MWMVFNIMYIFLIGLGLIIHSSITVINSMPCDADDGWLEYEDKCLKYYDTKVPWSSAKGTCDVLRQAQLATVDSPEINTFVQNNLTRDKDVWIGLSIDSESMSDWKWSDGGTTSSYDDWNNDWTNTNANTACAVMEYVRGNLNWHTNPCTHKKYFICEKELSGDNCSNWLHFDSHCYLIVNEAEETNMVAARNCWQYEAYLISINSKQEANFIYSKIKKTEEYWIGLSPLKWVDGVPYQWNNWGTNGPTYNSAYGCVYINATSGEWYSGYCWHSTDNYHHSYICQKATMINSETSQVAEEVETSTNNVLGESYTDKLDALNISNKPTQSSTDNSKQLLLTVVIPAVCGGLIAIILIIVVVILIRRKKRSNESNKRNPPQMNTTYVSNDIAVGGDNKDIDEHQDQEKYIYDEADVVQADNGTVVVNGDVYAIVDKDKIQNQKGLVNMLSQQQNNTKQEIAQGHNHIIVGSDVYAIVDKNHANQNKQHKPKQKKKKPQTPPKLDDQSSDINSNAPGHIVVGTDVYAVVDKENVKPNKQQTSQQKKKKPPAPPKLENKTVAINEENVYYNEFDMKTVPVTPTKRKPKVEKKTEDTGVVYADLDLTGSGSGDRQNGNNDEESGVVYADVRG